MAKMERDKDRLSFKEATAAMGGKEKIGYIWEYYKWIILGGIALFFVTFSMVHAFLTQMDSHLNISFISGFEYTMSAFGSLDFEAEDDPADLDAEYFLTEPPPSIWVDFEIIPILENLLLNDEELTGYDIIVQQLGINFETIPVFTTHTGAGVIDIIITYIPDLYAMAEIGHFRNISDLGWNIPVDKMHNEYAVYLRYFPIFNNYVAASADLVLGISATTRYIENVENFFEILLD